MGKLFKLAAVVGGVAAAVFASKKGNRDKIKGEYEKYKQDPESYKQNAKEVASQVGSVAVSNFNEAKEDPKAFAQKVKEDPKGFISEQKEKVKGEDTADEKVEAAKFDDEGGAANANLRVVSEEDLKKNGNKEK